MFTAADSKMNNYAGGFGNYSESEAGSSHVHGDYLKGSPPSASHVVLLHATERYSQ